MKSPVMYEFISWCNGLVDEHRIRTFCSEFSVQAPGQTEILKFLSDETVADSERESISREQSRDLDEIKEDSFFFLSFFFITNMSNQNSLSGKGQCKIALNKSFKPTNATNHSNLVSIAKSKGEEPPIGSVASEWRTISAKKLEVLERALFMLKIFGVREPPSDHQQFLMYEFQVAEFAKRINPRVPENLRAPDAPAIQPHRQGKTISGNRFHPYKVHKNMDSNVKVGPSQAEAQKIIEYLKNIRFFNDGMELTFYLQWPKCISSQGLWIQKISQGDAKNYGFHKVSVYVKDFDNSRVAHNPTDSEFTTMVDAAAFYLDTEIVGLLYKTKVDKIKDLWCQARPRVRTLEKNHRMHIKMQKMDLSK